MTYSPAAQPVPPRRSPWGWIAVVVVLAVIAGGLGFVLLNQRGNLGVAATPTASQPSPTPTLNQDLLSNRLTVLVLGLDSDDRRRARGAGLNSDTIMLASINADQSEVTLVSIPRDTVDIPLPDGTTWTSKINAIYAQQGVDALRGAIEELLAVDIDAYVQIDMGDLVTIVDAVGGVRVRPHAPLADAHLHLDIPAGRQTLDGQTAQGYVRTRVDNDFQRAARQQEVIQQIVRRLVQPERAIDIPALLSGLDSFETDLPLEDMPTYVELARRSRDARVTAQVLEPDDGFMTFAGDAGDGRGYILEPNIEAMRAFAAEHLVD
ncbi:MAG TPA: LCP family protein [Candidatus Limnocylindria bacterium]|nr:LCP family protein [Candidatus Limnocylindria bacterium]